MSPLWWETLYLMFSLSLILMSMIIYFNPKELQNSIIKKNKKDIDINWKW